MSNLLLLPYFKRSGMGPQRWKGVEGEPEILETRKVI